MKWNEQSVQETEHSYNIITYNPELQGNRKYDFFPWTGSFGQLILMIWFKYSIHQFA